MAVQGCKECGELSSTLRVYEFYDGFRGVLCPDHFKSISREKHEIYWPYGYESAISREPLYRVVPQTNADFLIELAEELESGGENHGASQARQQAAKFQRETDNALKEIGQYPPRDSGPPTVPPFLGF